MSDDQRAFFAIYQSPPARLTVQQVAWALNVQHHDIQVLVAHRLLKPLGNPAPNAVKYFASSTVFAHARDEAWLSKATRALYDHWQKKNAKRSEGDRS
jgi:hypothetical protein